MADPIRDKFLANIETAVVAEQRLNGNRVSEKALGELLFGAAKELFQDIGLRDSVETHFEILVEVDNEGNRIVRLQPISDIGRMVIARIDGSAGTC